MEENNLNNEVYQEQNVEFAPLSVEQNAEVAPTYQEEVLSSDANYQEPNNWEITNNTYEQISEEQPQEVNYPYVQNNYVDFGGAESSAYQGPSTEVDVNFVETPQEQQYVPEQVYVEQNVPTEQNGYMEFQYQGEENNNYDQGPSAEVDINFVETPQEAYVPEQVYVEQNVPVENNGYMEYAYQGEAPADNIEWPNADTDTGYVAPIEQEVYQEQPQEYVPQEQYVEEPQYAMEAPAQEYVENLEQPVESQPIAPPQEEPVQQEVYEEPQVYNDTLGPVAPVEQPVQEEYPSPTYEEPIVQPEINNQEVVYSEVIPDENREEQTIEEYYAEHGNNQEVFSENDYINNDYIEEQQQDVVPQEQPALVEVEEQVEQPVQVPEVQEIKPTEQLQTQLVEMPQMVEAKEEQIEKENSEPAVEQPQEVKEDVEYADEEFLNRSYEEKKLDFLLGLDNKKEDTPEVEPVKEEPKKEEIKKVEEHKKPIIYDKFGSGFNDNLSFDNSFDPGFQSFGSFNDFNDF